MSLDFPSLFYIHRLVQTHGTSLDFSHLVYYVLAAVFVYQDGRLH